MGCKRMIDNAACGICLWEIAYKKQHSNINVNISVVFVQIPVQNIGTQTLNTIQKK